jgi:molecular chaperone DnaJ
LVSQAYDVLGDEEKRKLYDQFGEDGLRDGFDPRRHAAHGAEAFAGFDFADIFGGRPGGGARATWGSAWRTSPTCSEAVPSAAAT